PLLVAPRGWKPPPRARRRPPSGVRVPGRRAAAAPASFGRVLVGLSGDDAGRDAALLREALAVVGAPSTTGAPSGAWMALHSIDVAGARHHPPPARALVRDDAEQRVARAFESLRGMVADAVPLEVAIAGGV